MLFIATLDFLIWWKNGLNGPNSLTGLFGHFAMADNGEEAIS